MNTEKAHRVFDAPHSIPTEALDAETIAWFDKYLGPVPIR